MKKLFFFSLLFTFLIFQDFSVDKKDNIVFKDIYYDNVRYTDNIYFYGVEGLHIHYSGDLKKPGDYYELSFDVVNSTGSKIVIKDCVYQKKDPYVSYSLTYDDGEKIIVGDTIDDGEVKRLKYRVSYVNMVPSSYQFDSSFFINYEYDL